MYEKRPLGHLKALQQGDSDDLDIAPTSKIWKKECLSMIMDLSTKHLWCQFFIFYENVHLPGTVKVNLKFTDFLEKNTFFSCTCNKFYS